MKGSKGGYLHSRDRRGFQGPWRGNGLWEEGKVKRNRGGVGCEGKVGGSRERTGEGAGS